MARFRVGLTGGIASGKSALGRCFERRGIVVVDADAAAREAVAPGSAGLGRLCEVFGDGILDPAGALDRLRMREAVFADDAARRRLEGIIHPIVREMLLDAADAAAGPYAIVAIPLLAEGGRQAYPWLARVLVVDVDPTVQQARVEARDGIDAQLAARMIAVQASRAQRLAIADDVVVNTGTLDDLDAHADALDRRYRMLAALAA